MLITGCAVPTWLTDATNLLPVLISGAASLLSFIAAISGQTIPAAALAEITTIANDVETELKVVEELIGEYNTTPNETVLQKIDAAAKLVVANLSKLLAVDGLPDAVNSKVQSIAQLLLTQFEAWLSLLPAVNAATAVAGARITITIPSTKKDLKSQFNAILDAPTGDAAVDAALQKTKRL